jgi:hypothetical protein
VNPALTQHARRRETGECIGGIIPEPHIVYCLHYNNEIEDSAVYRYRAGKKKQPSFRKGHAKEWL